MSSKFTEFSYPVFPLQHIHFWLFPFIDRFSATIRECMAGVLFYKMISCTAMLAFSFTAFDGNASKISFDLFCTILQSGLELSSAFVYCANADDITELIASIGDIFYNSLWYRMNVKEQKLVVSTIQRAQKPFRLNSYGICDCSREKFLKVWEGSQYFGFCQFRSLQMFYHFFRLCLFSNISSDASNRCFILFVFA